MDVLEILKLEGRHVFKFLKEYDRYTIYYVSIFNFSILFV